MGPTLMAAHSDPLTQRPVPLRHRLGPARRCNPFVEGGKGRPCNPQDPGLATFNSHHAPRDCEKSPARSRKEFGQIHGVLASSWLREHEFVPRFNNLFNALRNFASNYNGHVIDAKRAKAVRKALRDLEKSEWFNPRKAE